MSSLKYRSEIDGLRALAVLPVVLFHFGISLIPGGYIGVDVFFVISGFLITSIVLSEHAAGKFQLQDFWSRRIRRILPVLLVTVVVTLLIGLGVFFGPDLGIQSQYGLAALLSYANFSHWQAAGNYWGLQAESSAFLHTWSLAVEEQYYLFFPLLVILAQRYFPGELIRILFVLFLGSLALFFVGLFEFPVATFYLLPTRAWEMGAGALLAVMFIQQRSFLKDNPLLSLLGLALILISYIFLSGESGISPWMVFPVLGTVLIIGFTHNKGNPVRWILTALPMVFMGKISYSMYMWHWPVLVLAKNWAIKTGQELSWYILVPIILGLSVLSYFFVEIPFRKKSRSVPWIMLIWSGAVAFVIILQQTDHTISTDRFSPTVWSGENYNLAPRKDFPEFIKKRMAGITFPKQEAMSPKAFADQGILKSYGTDRINIMMLGDSHGNMWAPVIDEIAADNHFTIAFFTADGTPFYFKIPVQRGSNLESFSASEKLQFDQARMRMIETAKPQVILIAALAASISRFEDLQPLIEFAGKNGSTVVFLDDVPELFFGDKNTPQFLAYSGFQPRQGEEQLIATSANGNYYYNQSLEIIQTLLKRYPFCRLLSVADLFKRGEKALVLEGKDVLYIDDDHLSLAGAQQGKTRISQVLKELIPVHVSSR